MAVLQLWNVGIKNVHFNTRPIHLDGPDKSSTCKPWAPRRSNNSQEIPQTRVSTKISDGIVDVNPFNAKASFIFENHLNPVMLVLIRKFSLSTLRWVPICQGFSNFSGFLPHFLLAKLGLSTKKLKLHYISISASKHMFNCLEVIHSICEWRILCETLPEEKNYLNWTE